LITDGVITSTVDYSVCSLIFSNMLEAVPVDWLAWKKKTHRYH